MSKKILIVEDEPGLRLTLRDRLHSEESELMDSINSDGQLSDEQEEQLGNAIGEMIDDFGPDFDAEGNELEEGESDRIKSEDERAQPGRTSQDEGDVDESEDVDRDEATAGASA